MTDKLSDVIGVGDRSLVIYKHITSFTRVPPETLVNLPYQTVRCFPCTKSTLTTNDWTETHHYNRCLSPPSQTSDV